MISMNKIYSYIELARLNKPIGIYLLLWPALLGLIIAGVENSISIIEVFMVIIGAIRVRSWGGVINEIRDCKIANLVTSSIGGPLATGALSTSEAWTFFVFLSFLSILILMFTNTLTIKISLVAAFFIIIYPLTKRFFPAPQFFLGITFGSSVLIGHSLVTDVFSPSIILLYIGVIAWIISFDTYYALEDIKDDKKIGINSTAILWGDKAIRISRNLHLFFYFCIFLIAILNKFSFYFLISFLLMILIFFYQKKLIDKKDFLGAFKINNLIGMLTVTAFVFEIFIIKLW